MNNNQVFEPILGGIYIVDLPKDKDNPHAQYGKRPALVTQNIVGNCHSPIIIVVPITGAEHEKAIMPTHVFLNAKDCGLDKDSVALCEQPRIVPKTSFFEYISTLSPFYRNKIGYARAIAEPTMMWICDADIPKLKRYLVQKNTIDMKVAATA